MLVRVIRKEENMKTRQEGEKDEEREREGKEKKSPILKGCKERYRGKEEVEGWRR